MRDMQREHKNFHNPKLQRLPLSSPPLESTAQVLRHANSCERRYSNLEQTHLTLVAILKPVTSTSQRFQLSVHGPCAATAAPYNAYMVRQRRNIMRWMWSSKRLHGMHRVGCFFAWLVMVSCKKADGRI